VGSVIHVTLAVKGLVQEYPNFSFLGSFCPCKMKFGMEGYTEDASCMQNLKSGMCSFAVTPHIT